ncbi:MAG: hypothetical protein ACE5PV_26515 [Candidatus Poribacteria bacterium]
MNKTISENRWLPPSPHREEVLKFLEAGRAHIEERGHNIPPLLIFEDGGAIELPKVRYLMTRRGMQLVAAEDSSSNNQTKHSDVCGTIDELKGLLKEKPELLKSEPETLNKLLDDAHYMIFRMQRRRENYQKFADDIVSLYKRMTEIEEPELEQAYKKLDEIRAMLRDSPETVNSKVGEIYELAEGIRDVANNLESCLSRYKESAIKIGALYERIKGGRNWQKQAAKSS